MNNELLLCILWKCWPRVQCFPFQPGWQTHVPLLQCPCELAVHRGSHCRWLHVVPDQPSSQRQRWLEQRPWKPQSTVHSSDTNMHISPVHKYDGWPIGLQYTSSITVTVTEALVLRPLLEDRGRITESIRILVPVDRMKQKCSQITTK